MNRNKTHELTIDINAKNRENIENKTTFFSMDAGTGEKMINFTRDHMAYDLTGAEVHMAFHFIDEGATKLIDSTSGSVKIIDAFAGRCSVAIPSHVYDYEGDVMVHVYIMFENGQSVDCGVMTTTFKRSWLEGELPELERTSIERFNRLMELADEIKSKLEGLDVATSEDMSVHVNSRNNPHGVTAEQIGAATADHAHDWDSIINRPTSLTPGAHKHSASDINTGTFDISRIPTGSSAHQVALGNHTHAGMATEAWVNGRAAMIDTGWQNLGFASNARAHSDSNRPQYRRIGNIVYLRGALTNITHRDPRTTFATIPASFNGFNLRPSRSHSFIQNTSRGSGGVANSARWAVSTTGNISLEAATRVPVADHWFPLNTSYPIG